MIEIDHFEGYLDLVHCCDLVGLVPTDDLPPAADGAVLLNPPEDYPRVHFHFHRLACPLLLVYSNPS